MARAAVRESVTNAGRAARARVARAFAVGVLGPVHPCEDVAVLLVNRELFGNSVQHSGSGDPGETVTIAVRAGDGLARVEATDRSGPEYRSFVLPRVTRKMAGGLALVAGLAARWGWRRRGGRTVTSTAARLTSARGRRVPAVDQAVPARDLRRWYLPTTSGSPAACA
jgi:hypothetical protein